MIHRIIRHKFYRSSGRNLLPACQVQTGKISSQHTKQERHNDNRLLEAFLSEMFKTSHYSTIYVMLLHSPRS